MSDPSDPRERLQSLGGEIREGYARNKRVMSFEEYFALSCAQPQRQARSAAQYIKDVFDHFGTDAVRTPRGLVTRFRLFDCPWDQGRDRLLGQEEVQGRVYRTICNFTREGRVNKLILLHGPNGSAKSTFVACIARALEFYSTLDEGALYRFNWIFPSQKVATGGIGFGGSGAGYDGASRGDTYAYLSDDQVDAKLVDELRDHPLLLIPSKRRREILAERPGDGFVPADYILYGELGHKNRQIFEALLAKYRGDFLKVLRHVQVERFYIQRRYREGVVTIEPQLHVDARSRQITMDRSVAALPPVLHSVSLHEYSGELVDANRGMIEYSDLLKRPIETYKYLLGTVEQGKVTLENAILPLDMVFIGSSNESHLAVFKEVPEFQSFKGRLELVRVPYLLDYTIERRIYDEKIRPSGLGKHLSPHATHVAALWAVLTRMRKPLPEKYPKGLSELISRLAPLEKAELYARGIAPDPYSPEQAKDLIASIDRIWGESDAYPNYEGRTGASPREIQTMLLNAASNPKHQCLSPLAILDEMEELVRNVTVYEFLKQEPLPGGYHENRKFIYLVRDRYVDLVDDEVRTSMGLVEEREYGRLFEKYVTHVTHWIRKEKVRNPVTGRLEDPDEEMMSEVEKTLGVGAKRDDFRADAISRIGAWSVDHPNQRPNYGEIFPKQFSQLRESYFERHKRLVKKTIEDLLVYLTDGPGRISDREAKTRVEDTLTNMKDRCGYCDLCAKEAVSFLLRKRYV
ncbi:MAG: serine protein kinase PrkA [Deltaproteobacteria bacterium]|nr:serine protein kinase PrkA [Deltaproteobacteria bacterium]